MGVGSRWPAVSLANSIQIFLGQSNFNSWHPHHDPDLSQICSCSWTKIDRHFLTGNFGDWKCFRRGRTLCCPLTCILRAQTIWCETKLTKNKWQKYCRDIYPTLHARMGGSDSWRSALVIKTRVSETHSVKLRRLSWGHRRKPQFSRIDNRGGSISSH